MSHTVVSAVFGATDANANNPRSIRVVADLVVGGSGVLVVHALESGRRIRIRPDAVSLAAALIAGFALVGEIVLDPGTARVAERLTHPEDDIELGAADAAALRQAVADMDVTVVITTLDPPSEIDARHFDDTAWSVFVADAVDVSGRAAPNWR